MADVVGLLYEDELRKATTAEIERLTAENERLRGLIKAGSEQVERLAFSVPPPNSYTPQFVLLAQALRREALNQQQAVNSEEGK